MCQSITFDNGLTIRNFNFVPKENLKITVYTQAGTANGFKYSENNLRLDGTVRYESREYWKNRNFKSGLMTGVISYSERDSFGNPFEFTKEGNIVVMVNENIGKIKIVTRAAKQGRELEIHDRHPLYQNELREINAGRFN